MCHLMLTRYHPSEEVSKEMNAKGVQTYQELIGILRWAVEIGRVDILLEVSLLSSHLELPRVGHLQAVYHIFGNLKQVPKRKIYFDPINPSISEDRFKSFDCEDFYKDTQEPIPIDMPSLREEINVNSLLCRCKSQGRQNNKAIDDRDPHIL